MRRHRRHVLRTGAALLAGVLAGCSGDGGGGSPSPTRTETPTPTPSPTPTPTETPTPTPTPEPAPARERYPNYQWSKLEGVDPVPTRTIRMSAYEFVPLAAAFEPGAEVTVVNEDADSHTITVPLLGIDERIPGGERASFTVDRAGTFEYVCAYHATLMLGRLVVTEDVPTATPPETTTTEEDDDY